MTTKIGVICGIDQFLTLEWKTFFYSILVLHGIQEKTKTMKRVISLISVVLGVLLLPSLVEGQMPDDRQVIRLQVATFDPLVDGEPSLVVPVAPAVVPDNPYYIIQFTGPVEAVWIAQLEQLGATVLGYIPENAHIVRVQPEDVERVRSMYAVRWMGPYRAGYKLAPALATGPALVSEDVSTFTVVAFPGESLRAIRAFLVEQGAMVHAAADTTTGIIFHVDMPAHMLPTLAQHPAIAWIEPYVMPETANAPGRQVMGVESVWQNQRFFGEGQIVAISDSGLSVQGELGVEFEGRLVRAFAPSEMNPQIPQCIAKPNWTDLHGHGTHVAGSVLGSGVKSGSNPAALQYTGSHAGAAPQARFVFMSLGVDQSSSMPCVPPNENYIAFGYREGARVSSNSWGADTGGEYNLLAQIVDDYIWRNKDYLVLFSAGNTGPDPSTVGSPGVAKNLLTVGASENNRPELGMPNADNPNQMADFSSRGPTSDGRVKPDVVAPGTFILSARAAQAPDRNFWQAYNSDYAYMGGTSMATPLTAGAATLVREWLVKERGMPNPSAAFMKALLIHGAARLPNSALPNNDSGWGRVDLKNTLEGRYAIFDDHVQGLQTGQAVTYTIQVAGSGTAGTLFAATRPTTTGPTLATAEDFTLIATSPSATNGVPADPAMFDLIAAPGFATAPTTLPIATAGSDTKDGLSPRSGPTPPASVPATSSATLRPAADAPAVQSFLHNMVGGGDFEDPGWTNIWSRVWLGAGIPLRTNSSLPGLSGVVLNGQASIWLGGTDIEDSIWYPLSFPEQIASDNPSYLTFLLQMRNLDPGYDRFCVALVDASGLVISGLQDCYDDLPEGETRRYTRPFTPIELQALQGQTGYLVLYIEGDNLLPHMSTFVDDIDLKIDFPDVTLTSTPAQGPAGTTFLLTGKNNLPYSPVDICLITCADAANRLGTLYANAQGTVIGYVPSEPSASPGVYPIQSVDLVGRTAETTITLIGDIQPVLTITPSAGVAGTTFSVTAQGFLPNDRAVAVIINNTDAGVVSSDAEGTLEFSIRTGSNVPPGIVTVQLTDSAGRSATATFEIIAIPEGDPQLVVEPEAGLPGSAFVFTGSNFTPGTPVRFTLDGQAVGELPADGSGSFVATLTTRSTILPGTYTLLAQQGGLLAQQDTLQASAQFRIIGDDSGQQPQPGGGGIYVTLVWVDPPANAAAERKLVNNLDLRVDGPGGPYLGNGGSSADVLNNVEVVRLERPAPGTYTVTVQAQSVNGTFGAQPFALVATTAQNFNTNTASARIGEGVFDNAVYLPLIVR